ncbi:MAG: hypothetical protein R3314_08985 [Longimicrobiales bacterium]|nr:hypothetical protein [Longimicrobiales bacterium]
MKQFTAEDGREWVATAHEEDTPRHHGRWYLVLHPADSDEPALTVPEVRWKSRHTAERTLATMSDFELQRRLRIAARRHDVPGMDRNPFGAWKGGGPGAKGGTEAG